LIDIFMLTSSVATSLVLHHHLLHILLFFFARLYESSEDTNFISLVPCEVKSVILGLSKLIEIVVKCLLGKSNFLSGSFKCINSFPFFVYLLIKFPPLSNWVDSLFYCSLFYFSLFGLWWARLLRQRIFWNNFSVSYLDRISQKKFVFEHDFLMKRVLPDKYMHFPVKIEIKNMWICYIDRVSVNLGQSSGNVELSGRGHIGDIDRCANNYSSEFVGKCERFG
jgi:hypothetical protein